MGWKGRAGETVSAGGVGRYESVAGGFGDERAEHADPAKQSGATACLQGQLPQPSTAQPSAHSAGTAALAHAHAP